jgi:hypothetical protein
MPANENKYLAWPIKPFALLACTAYRFINDINFKITLKKFAKYTQKNQYY